MISKRTWRIFLIILVISLPIRLYQALFLLEPGTGFYSDGYLSTGALLIVLMAGCALLCAETAREKQMVPRLPVRSLGAAVVGMFTGFLFCGQSIYSLLGAPAVDNPGMNGILAAAGILAGLAFLWQSYGHAMGGQPLGAPSAAGAAAAAVGLRVPRGAVSLLFRDGEYGRQCV